MKRVLYFGIYNPDFIRNKVIALGFERNGYEVVHCRVDPSELPGLRKYRALYKMGRRYRTGNFSHVIVGFPGPTVVWLAYLLFGRRVIFDAFLSQYDTNVLDRKLYGRWSLRGIKDWFLDWYSCALAWRVLLPENVHIDFFVETFRIPRRKFVRIFTGANDEVFHPVPDVEKTPVFTAHFHGNFIPLQGVQYIVEAADILRDEDIEFQIVGSGGELFRSIEARVKELGLSNVKLLGRKPLEELPALIARAHICLGVFGDSQKAKRVISNKVYEYLASRAAVITARTPAMEELLVDREHVLFCDSSSGEDMAAKIRELKQDSELREGIAERSYRLFKERLTPERLVDGLITSLPTATT